MKRTTAIPTTINISEEVQEALSSGKAVVALESTIIAHGMPYPKNVQTAEAVELLVRKEGAIPATIAVLNGKIQVGLNSSQLESLAKKENVWKVSIRDLPYVLARKYDGATTVAATMRIASIAGINFFVTGGIGGVHRDAQKTMDISADLTEMSRTNVAIISAGVKSILDIGLTLEVLETLGVPVLSIGQDEFPSFYSAKSSFQSPLRLDSLKDIAIMAKTKWDLGIEGAILIANPLPPEYDFPHHEIEKYIQKVISLAEENGVTGKKVTPFILKNMAEITAGKSLEANIALVKNNAMVGSRIALEYAKLKSEN